MNDIEYLLYKIKEIIVDGNIDLKKPEEFLL